MAMKGEDMADKMEFPKTMREFIDNHSFKDSEEVYTNGAELVPVFRVEQALEHYEKEIRNKAIDDFVKEICKMIIQSEKNGNYRFYAVEIKQAIVDLAEQLKAGVEE